MPAGITALGFLLAFSAVSADPPLPQFTDIAAESGIAFKHGSGAPEKNYIFEAKGGGVALLDYDNDGWLDITKMNFSFDYSNLYHNERNGLFSERSMTSGIAQATMPLVCWGTRFIDYDNDGWKDIFVAAGHVYPHLITAPAGGERYGERKLLFRNLGNGRFAEVGMQSGQGMQILKSARGCAFGDLDNDGDMDVVVTHLDDSPSVLRNDGGNRKNWISIRLKGTKWNRFGLGARVKVSAGSLTQIGEPTTASSIFSANDPRLHFGLGDARQVDIEVVWPGDRTQIFRAVPANRAVSIDQDKGLETSG